MWAGSWRSAGGQTRAPGPLRPCPRSCASSVAPCVDHCLQSGRRHRVEVADDLAHDQPERQGCVCPRVGGNDRGTGAGSRPVRSNGGSPPVTTITVESGRILACHVHRVPPLELPRSGSSGRWRRSRRGHPLSPAAPSSPAFVRPEAYLVTTRSPMDRGQDVKPSRRASVRSITSSAPPPMESSRLSRKYRAVQVSSM